MKVIIIISLGSGHVTVAGAGHVAAEAPVTGEETTGTVGTTATITAARPEITSTVAVAGTGSIRPAAAVAGDNHSSNSKEDGVAAEIVT